MDINNIKKIYEVKGRYAAFSGEDRRRYFGKLVFCIKTNVIYLPLPSSTSFYVKKIYEVKGRYAAFSGEDRRRYFGKRVFCIKTNVFYLPLPSSTSFYVKKIYEVKGRYAAFSGEDRRRYFGKLVFCIKTNVIYLPLPPSISFYLRMSRRYRKLQEDMPLSASKIEDDTLASWCSASKQMSFISIYLLLVSDVKKI